MNMNIPSAPRIELPSLPNGTSVGLPVALGSDAYFFEESISPSSIRSDLSGADPSNISSTPVLSKGMKWLLAMMSKGRDVSDFFPYVVKLVDARSLEVRKMVYMYLVHFADHDDTCRELSLLSINSFQRGLGDHEQLIRALALRVMSSIRLADILQIQILALQKCAKDRSPYVRKCAANALAKLHFQCSDDEKNLLKKLLKNMLDEDGSTMVLTSAIIAFWELYPTDFEMLNGSYRKLCHLLTDMDEWGQVIAMECLASYCRRSFKKPKSGTGELIDQGRRLRRTIKVNKSTNTKEDENENKYSSEDLQLLNGSHSRDTSPNKYNKKTNLPRKIKRRVVRKAFYSDEEDESSEEEVYADDMNGISMTLASAMRQPSSTTINQQHTSGNQQHNEDEDIDLHEDHRLLLRSSLPLLKSRNSAVVLAVCSLHYYCGVSSIKIRTAMGKALVRIHRDRREIQYVVLSSIKELVSECPSAFMPFLSDFFVKALDPSFTRRIKLDILTDLALEPNAIKDILHEIRSYIRHDDKEFVCASIRAIGRLVETAYTIHKRTLVDPKEAKRESDTVALNCLHGLYALTLCCRKKEVISECVITMVNIMGFLSSHHNTKDVKDPNKVRSNVVRKLLFLLIRSLAFSTKNQQQQEITSEDEETKEELRKEWLLHNNTREETLCLTTDATSSALWFISEWLISPNQHKMYPDLSQSQRTEVMNGILCLLSSSFPSFEPTLKLHSIHFASKLLLFLSSLGNDQNAVARASNILAQGRLDLNLDVRDRARFESSLLYQVVPSILVDFPEGMNHASAAAANPEKKLTLEQGKQILLASKPPSTFLPVDLGEKNKEEIFRFGTLSSLVHHRAGRAYLPLPPWAEKDSDAKLRDPAATSTSTSSGSATSQNNRIEKKEKGFYDDDDDTSSSSESDSDDDDESESESDSDESSSSSYESESDESDSEESSSEYDSSSSEDSDDEIKNNVNLVENKVGNLIGLGNTDFVQNVSAPSNHPNLPPNTTSKSMLDESSSSSEETSSSDSDTDSDSESDDDDPLVSMTNKKKGTNTIATSDTLLPMMSNMNLDSSSNTTNQKTNNNNKFNTSSTMSDDLSGLVMPPPVYDNIDEEEESSADDTSDLGPWERIVRPELAGGLAVDMRFVRRNTKKKELSRNNNNLKFDLVNDRVILIQCRFQNKRTSGKIRRIRILQSTRSSGLRHAIVPLEITALDKNQITNAYMTLVFMGSQNISSLKAHFDFKTDKGSTAVDIRPSYAEMLEKLSMDKQKFDETIEKKLYSPHQKTESTLSNVSSSSSSKKPIFNQDGVLSDEAKRNVQKFANLTPVKGSSKKSCFSASLSLAKEVVCVSITSEGRSSSTNTVRVHVYCDNAIMANAIMDAVKLSLTQ